MDPKAFLIELSRYTRKHQLSEEITNEQIWETIMKICLSNTISFLPFQYPLNQLISANEEIREASKKYVEPYLEQLNDETKSVADRISVLSTITPLIPFITTEHAQKIFTVIFTIADNLYKNNDFKNEALIRAIDVIETPMVPAATFEAVYEEFVSRSNPSSLFVVAPIAGDLLNIVGDAIKLFNQRLLEYIDGDLGSQIATAFFLERLSDFYGTAPGMFPSALFKKLIPHLNAKEIHFHKAARQLIAALAFQDNESVEALFGLQYAKEDAPLFFKLYTSFFKELENVPPELIVYIIDFAKKSLKEYPGKSLSILSTAGQLEPSLISDCLTEAVNSAKQLIQDKVELIDAAQFLIVAQKILPDSDFSESINTLSTCIDSFTKMKQKLIFAEELATLSPANPAVIEFIKRCASQEWKGTEIIYFCTLLLNAVHDLPVDVATIVLEKLTADFRNTKNVNALNSMLLIIKKLTKVCKTSTPLASDIINGRIAILGGLPPVAVLDDSPNYFYLLNALAKRGQDDSIPPIEWIDWSPISVLSDILLPILTGLSRGVISPSPEYVDHLVNALLDMTITDEDSVCAIVECLSIISKTTDVDTHKIIERLTSIMLTPTEEEEESDALAPVVIPRLMIELYQKPSTVIEEEPFLTLLEQFPLKQEEANVILMHLLFSFISDERFAPFEEQICMLAADVLKRKRSEAMQLVDQETFDLMKQYVKSAILKKPQLEKTIVKGFSRAEQNAFGKIFK